MFEHSFWHNKKRRKILLAWKRQSGFCLSLAIKNLGSTAYVSKLCVTVFTLRRERRDKDNLHIIFFMNYRY